MCASARRTDRRNERATATWENSQWPRLQRCTHQPMEDGWLATFEEITDRRAAEARMVHLAHHDALTDLPNRVLFRQKLEHALAYVRRGEKLALLCPRPRPVQGGQRHAGASGRRRAAAGRGRAAGAGRRARLTPWRASAATSSPSCSRADRRADRGDRARQPADRAVRRAVRGRTATRSSSAPASASPSRRRTAPTPINC